MKSNQGLQKWCCAAVIATAVGSARICLADINYTFNSDTEGWVLGGGNGTVTWDGSHGFGGSGGCLKVTSYASFDDGAFPTINVAYDTTTMWSIEADIMVEPGTGQDGNGNYGNVQAFVANADWGWDSIWYGGIDGSFVGAYKHIKLSRSGGPFEPKAHLQFLIQAGGGAFGADSVMYIDNVVIRVIPPPPQVFVINAFQRSSDATPGWMGSDGSPVPTADWSTTHDAGGGFTPEGSFHVQEPYDGAAGWAGIKAQFNLEWDPSAFTYFECDVYLDAPKGLSTYGYVDLALISSSWGWNSMGTFNLSEANVGVWTHISMPIANAGVGNSSHGYVLRAGGNDIPAATFNYYYDNVSVWKPANPPTIKQMSRANGIGGVQITINGGDQWQRDAIVTPSNPGNCFWVAEATPDNPVTYAFTIADFPDAVDHSGFEAHLYIVNEDTASSWDETYGACDWNAADLVRVHLTANGGGGYDYSLDWKTNRAGANPPDGEPYHPASVHSETALGTWSVTFTNNTDGLLSGPGGISAGFRLPPETVASFNPTTSFLQFGMSKNDSANDGHNNGAHGTLSRVQKNGGSYMFDDTFAGPGLNAAFAWRTTSATAIQWVPPGTAWWFTWTTPDDGFALKVAGDVKGPFTDAGVVYTYPQGANRIGAVPAASLPAGNAAFFRLEKLGQ